MSPPADVLRISETRMRVTEGAQAQALEALLRSYPYLGENFNAWNGAVTEAAPVLLNSQLAAASVSETFVSGSMRAQGDTAGSDLRFRPAGFVDLTDGGGSWLKNLVYSPLSAYKAALPLGTAVAGARARFVAGAIVSDGIRDAARSGDMTNLFGWRATGYVRTLRGKTCARCAVLAGRIYRVEAFQRHPRCDCGMTPVSRVNKRAGSWKTDPAAYFNRLTGAEQESIFGEAAAIAIRASSNQEFTIGQVVNAEQGVYQVSAYGRDVSATRSGTTVRGTYGGYEIMPDGTFRKRTRDELMRDKSVSKYRFARTPRLMPDQIIALSDEFGWSREMTLQQFKRFGYIY